jgi:hypothetical protein
VLGVLTAVLALAGLAFGAQSAAAEWRVWSTTPPSGAKVSRLEGISCWTGEACMAVGDYVNKSGVQEPLADDLATTELPPNPTAGKEPLLVNVSCTKGTIFCMAVGEYTESDGYTHVYAEKFSKKTWTLETMPLPPEGFASSIGTVACPTSSECIAVGTYHDPKTGEHYLAEKWSSSSGWKAETPTEPAGVGYGAIIALSCPGSVTKCMSATVYRKNAGRVEMEGEELNGTTWTPVAMSNPAGYSALYTISDFCESLTACVSVGWWVNSISGDAESQAQTWNGTQWKAMKTPNAPSSSSDELTGVSCLEGIKECFAVGKAVVSGLTEALGEELKGTAWSLLTLARITGAKESTLSRISCAPSVCYAAGWYVNSSNETSLLIEASL